MAMYNLIEYSDNHSDTSGSLWQSKRDKKKEMLMLVVFQIICHHLNINQVLLRTEMV